MTIFDAHGVLTFRARHRIRESLKGGGGILYYLYLSSKLLNTDEETDFCAQVAAKVVGPERVRTDIPPMMGSEDFGWMLMEKSGCYLFIGNGTEELGGCMVHNPHYDFNDNILATGAAYWVELVREALPEY